MIYILLVLAYLIGFINPTMPTKDAVVKKQNLLEFFLVAGKSYATIYFINAIYPNPWLCLLSAFFLFVGHCNYIFRTKKDYHSLGILFGTTLVIQPLCACVGLVIYLVLIRAFHGKMNASIFSSAVTVVLFCSAGKGDREASLFYLVYASVLFLLVFIQHENKLELCLKEYNGFLPVFGGSNEEQIKNGRFSRRSGYLNGGTKKEKD